MGPAAGTLQPQFYPRRLNLQVHGLRGLAALLVFFFHVYAISAEQGYLSPGTAAALDWLRFGRHGVELFFIISGYLIAGSVERHGDARRFLIDRCIRIYPVFLAIHLLVFGLGPALHYKWMAGISLGAWLKNFAANALFLPGVFDLPLAQLNAWTLSYEAAFYLVAASIWLIGRRLGREAAWVSLLLAAAPLLWLYPKASFFLVGAAIHFLKPRARMGTPPALRLLSPLLLAAMLFIVAYDEDPAGPIYLGCVPGFLFFWSIVDGGCAVSAVLRTRVLQYFGTISYSFYLWSALVTYPLRLAIPHVVPAPAGSVLAVAILGGAGFALSVGVSHLSFLVLEERVGRWLRRAAGSRRPTAMPPLSAEITAEGGGS